jgi:tungstate transport system permease protein
VEYVIEMLRRGFGLIGDDRATVHVLVAHTLQMTLTATVMAVVAGLPVAYWIASRDSAATRAARMLANVGLGLPPVGVGVYWLVAWHWYPPYLTGYYKLGTVQAVISLPIIVALCAAAFARVPRGLVDQARAFGASGWRLALFKLREAKVGIIAAVIVAIGASIGEVGAITVVAMTGRPGPGGTLSTELLYTSSYYLAGPDQYLVEYAIVLAGMLLVLGVLLTIVQQSSGRSLRRLLVTRPAIPLGARP